MIQQIISAAYFLGAVLFILINPFMISIFVITAYMKGESHRIIEPLKAGFFSFAELSVYVILIAIAAFFIKGVLRALKHPWWNRG